MATNRKDNYTPEEKRAILSEMLFKEKSDGKWWHPVLADHYYIMYHPETDPLADIIRRIINHVKKS